MSIPALPDDLEDPRLAPFRELRERRGGEHFVVEGELAVGRLLNSALGWELHGVVGTASRLSRQTTALKGRCPAFEATHAQMRELTGFDFHRGILASARRRRSWGLEALETSVRARVIVAHGIADPPNLGAIARNARAFGATMMAIDAGAADPFAGKSLRASAGQIFDLPCVLYDSLDELERLLREQMRCQLWAATLGPHSLDLERLVHPAPTRVALLIGNEGEGLEPELVARCEQEVHIPMDAGVDSLNAAAASAVMLYALRLGQAREAQSFAPK